MDRRHFFKLAGGFTVSTLASGLTGCKAGTGGGTTVTKATTGIIVFPQGVASGDPKADSSVFWVRATRADGTAGDIALTLELCNTAKFDTVSSFSVVAQAAFDGTVRHKVTGLVAGQYYYYRFTAGNDISPVGRTKTLPATGDTVLQVGFAVINGLDWNAGHWGALPALLDEAGVDHIVFLGNAINESVPNTTGPYVTENLHPVLNLPNGTVYETGKKSASTLADYRYLHNTYRTDPRWQAILARFPLIAIWGDRDFTRDGWQDHETYDNSNPAVPARAAAARQAWLESMPVDWSDLRYDPSQPGSLQLYRDFQFGNMAHLLVMEQRFSRADHAVPEDQPHAPLNLTGVVGARYFVDAAEPALASASQTMLGSTQLAWLEGKLSQSTALWKVLAGESSMLKLGLDLRADTDLVPALQRNYILDADGWDGYPAERTALTTAISNSGKTNVVAFSGASMFAAGEIWRDYSQTRNPVAIEFATAAISTSSFFTNLQTEMGLDTAAGLQPLQNIANAPGALSSLMLAQSASWLKSVDATAQGYTVVTISSTAMLVDFVKIPALVDGVGSSTNNTFVRATLPVNTLQLSFASSG